MYPTVAHCRHQRSRWTHTSRLHQRDSLPERKAAISLRYHQQRNLGRVPTLTASQRPSAQVLAGLWLYEPHQVGFWAVGMACAAVLLREQSNSGRLDSTSPSLSAIAE